MGKRMWTTADIRELRRRRWAPEFATRRTLAEAFGVSLSSIDHALYVNGITVEKLRGKQRGGQTGPGTCGTLLCATAFVRACLSRGGSALDPP